MSTQTSQFGYNLALHFVQLACKKEKTSLAAINGMQKIFEEWTGHIKLLQQANGAMTELHKDGQVVAVQIRNLLDRVRLYFPDILTDKGSYIWNGAERVRHQQELFREKITEIQQKIQAKMPEIGHVQQAVQDIMQTGGRVISEYKEHILRMLKNG